MYLFFFSSTDCSLGALTLPDINVPLNCYIPDYCTGIDCCYEYDFLGISLRTYLYINTCEYKISGGIEKLTFEYNLLDAVGFEWGMCFFTFSN